MNSTPKEVVLGFLTEVRSGKNPTAAATYMSHTVSAHQVISEDRQVVVRTPDEYAQHVAEMLEEYGDFSFSVDELLADGDKVYARWTQVGNGITEVASCVYRIESGLITEYWIQIDRLGLEIQKSRRR